MPYYRWNPIYTTAQDSLMLLNHLGSHAKAAYWYGRGKPNSNYNFASPMVHDYVTGPYKLAPDESFHVVYAEVAGFGPGRVKDYDKYGASLYSDYGGGNEGTINAAQDYFHPVPSWDSVITYTNAPTSISSTGGIGIAYTPTYGYPTYIRDTNVITIRDVADRCIQLYRGSPTVVKYDTAQYEPSGDKNNVTVSTNGYASSPAEIAARSGGWNAAFLNATSGSNKMAYPNPITNAVSVSTFMPGVFVKDSTVISAKITWNSAVDDVPTTIKPYVNGLKNYEIVRSTSPLGPWSTIASIIPKNASYLDGSEYKYYDYNVKIGATYYYAVISVDSTDKKNGVMTAKSLTVENVAFEKMNKVYVAPNPFFLTSGLPGESVSSPYIGFYGLTAKATIHIYSFAGQLVKVIHHDKNTTDEKWNLLNESGKKIASGVYYFTVEDLNTGNKAWNKFVVIH
jgi:hypothetical protein